MSLLRWILYRFSSSPLAVWWGSISLYNPAVILVASSLSGHELHQCMFWRPCHQGQEGECLRDVLTLCLVVCLSLTFIPLGHTIFSFCLCVSLIFYLFLFQRLFSVFSLFLFCLSHSYSFSFFSPFSSFSILLFLLLSGCPSTVPSISCLGFTKIPVSYL